MAEYRESSAHLRKAMHLDPTNPLLPFALKGVCITIYVSGQSAGLNQYSGDLDVDLASTIADLMIILANRFQLKVGDFKALRKSSGEDLTTLDQTKTLINLVMRPDESIEVVENAQSPAFQARKRNSEGSTLMEANSFAEAEAKFTAAIELNPKGKETHKYYCNRARARFEVGSKSKPPDIWLIERAIEDCEASLRLFPGYESADFNKHYYKGVAADLGNDMETAVEHFSKALTYQVLFCYFFC